MSSSAKRVAGIPVNQSKQRSSVANQRDQHKRVANTPEMQEGREGLSTMEADECA